jgi:hypothetical protein
MRGLFSITSVEDEHRYPKNEHQGKPCFGRHERGKSPVHGASIAFLVVALLSGCGSAITDTLKVEATLAVTDSLVAHAVDGADALLEARTRAQMATDPAGAKAAYASYKPKIEKARLAVHTGQDVITDAESARASIPSGGDASRFTAWMPALSQALIALQQAYADIKGLVQ